MIYKFLLLLFTTLTLFAQENLKEVLLPLKNEIKELEIKSIKEKKEINKYEWLDKPTVDFSHSKENESLDSKNYSININQKIADFGGISAQIDYSNYLFKQEALKIEMENLEDSCLSD